MKWQGWLAVCTLGIAPWAHGQGFGTFNPSSLARAVALPSLGQGAPLAAGAVQSGMALEWSNEFFQRSTAREDLILDGETLRLGLHYRRGVALGARDAEWSLELPLLFTGGGVQDPFIEGWHDFFNLPNSNRDDAPQNRYRIRYVRDGVTQVDLGKGENTLGDARLGAGLSLSSRWTLRALVQLPTGNRRQLTGGHLGGGLWTDYVLPLGDSGRASLTFSAGASAAATGGPLSSQQKPWTAVAGVVLVAPVYGALDAVVQVNGHTALYKGSTLAPLSRAGLPLMFGLRWPWQRLVLDLAAIEDPSVNASPDFGLRFGVSLKTD